MAMGGCQTVYYGALEKFGVEKREILVDRVEEARDDQEAAKEQFQTALEQFKAATGFEGGELEEVYNRLNREYERSKSRADDVHSSIERVDNVANALFKEWENELEDYTNESLRRDSAMKLQLTRERYSKLIGTMRRAESSIAPVLSVFSDQVLYLKHNLNAQAIASLQTQVSQIETDVSSLLRDMEASIAEANAFIADMGQDEA
jgi:hypothetical protein